MLNKLKILTVIVAVSTFVVAYASTQTFESTNSLEKQVNLIIED